MKFSPCNNLCSDEGAHCSGCGRSHAEIAETKLLVKNLVEFAKRQDYDNVEAFADYMKNKLIKKYQEV